MSEHITSGDERAAIWNSRFSDRLRKMGYSQHSFAKAYRERFGSGSQSSVNKWLNVGITDGRSRKERHFPEFETMRNIAELLEVSVGYLIGETDYDTFEIERASEYLRLDPDAIISIKRITSGKAIPPFHRFPDEGCNAALSSMLTSPTLLKFLQELCELAKAEAGLYNSTNNFKSAVNSIPESKREQAIQLWSDAEDAVKSGIVPSDELWAYTMLLNNAAEDDMRQEDMHSWPVKASKYALQELHFKLVEEILNSGKIQVISAFQESAME